MSKKKQTKQDKVKARKRTPPVKASQAAPEVTAPPVEVPEAEPQRAKKSSAKHAGSPAEKAKPVSKTSKRTAAQPSKQESKQTSGKRASKAARAEAPERRDSGAEAVAEVSFANSPFAEGEALESSDGDASEETQSGADTPSGGAPSAGSESNQAPVAEAKGKAKKSGKKPSKQAQRKPGADSQLTHAALDEAAAPATEVAPPAKEQETASTPDVAEAEVAEVVVDAALADDDWSDEADVAGALAASLLEGDGTAADADADPDEPPLSDEETNHRYLKGLIESLLFSAEKPLSMRELARAARLDKKRTTELLKEVTRDFRKRGMNVVEIAGGFGFRSNPAYAPYVQKLLSLRPVRLSRAQLETLAVIAYRQPVTRPEVDDVRGVDSGQVIKGLLDRDLIKMLGKKDEVGRPMLYGTTPAFLELFSLESLKDLPNLREFTELSDDSREKFKDAMGENAPGVSGLEANGQSSDESVATDEPPPDSEPSEELSDGPPSDAPPSSDSVSAEVASEAPASDSLSEDVASGEDSDLETRID